VSNRRFAVFFVLGIVALAALYAFLDARSRHPSVSVGAPMFRFAPEEVCGVDIRREGEKEMRLDRDADGTWSMTSPYAAEIDKGVVDRMLDAVLFERSSDALSVSDMRSVGGDMADFALSPPRLSLGLRTADGRRRSLDLGRATPGGGEVYARLDGDGAVLTVSTNVVVCVPQSSEAFRRRSVVSLVRREIDGVEIKEPGASFVKIVRGEGRWRIVEPTSAPADFGCVDAALDRIAAARIVSYVWPSETAEKVAPSAYGLDADVGVSVTLRNAAGEDEQIVFGNAAGTNLVYALISNGRAIVTVESSLAAAFKAGEAGFRDWRAFPFAADELRSVSVSYGSVVYVLTRGKGGWRLESPVDAPADARRVDELLAKICTLREDGLASAGGERQVSLSVAVASTNLAPVSVPIGFVGGAEALADLRSKTMLALDPASVLRLRVTSGAGETSVVRDAVRGTWSPAADMAGKRVDQAAVGRTIGMLANVEAESVEQLSVSPDDLKRFGLDSPAFTISVDVDASDAVRKNLMIGHAAPGGGRYATVGGADAVFVLPRTAVASLTLPLVE